jgi:hypothetical protein
VRHAEADLRKAEAEVEEAERRDRDVEVKVDGQVRRVPRGTYVVADFKRLVGVAADRELDIVHHDVFKPLNDDAEITIHQCEVFVSHVRTGGSACCHRAGAEGAAGGAKFRCGKPVLYTRHSGR